MVCSTCQAQLMELDRPALEPVKVPEMPVPKCSVCGQPTRSYRLHIDRSCCGVYDIVCDACAKKGDNLMRGRGRNMSKRFPAGGVIEGVPYVKFSWGDDHGGRGKRVVYLREPKSLLSEKCAQEEEECRAAEEKGQEYRGPSREIK